MVLTPNPTPTPVHSPAPPDPNTFTQTSVLSGRLQLPLPRFTPQLSTTSPNPSSVPFIYGTVSRFLPHLPLPTFPPNSRPRKSPNPGLRSQPQTSDPELRHTPEYPPATLWNSGQTQKANHTLLLPLPDAGGKGKVLHPSPQTQRRGIPFLARITTRAV